ncbi:zinc metalloprotease HtpX [Priestia megaterium]|nr:zinc metalloprotease HtpX [Priestia megaterium]
MLFEQIAANKRKTVFYIFGFIFFVLLIGSVISMAIAGYANWMFGTIITAIIMLFYVPITLLNSTSIVMKLNHAQEIKDAKEQPFLWYTVESLAIAAQLPMPRVYVINDPSPNAFATGSKPEKAAIAVTIGLLEKLEREEIEAVVAHEMAHIQNYDVRLTTISLALVSIVAFLSDIGLRIFFVKDSKNSNPVFLVIAFILLILAPIIAVVIQMGLSRNREYLADATGAELCRNPQALASALHKITADTDPIEEISKASASMYFCDPFKRAYSKTFATHPPTEKRIQRLMNM